jgi:hypothetical protein
MVAFHGPLVSYPHRGLSLSASQARNNPIKKNTGSVLRKYSIYPVYFLQKMSIILV